MYESILLVTRDDTLRGTLEHHFAGTAFSLTCERDPFAAWAAVSRALPCLAIVDHSLPGMTGLAFMRRLRRDERTALLPIVLFGDNASEESTVAALDAGADEFLVRPFSLAELSARIKALLRRAGSGTPSHILRCEDLVLNPTAYRLEGRDGIIDLRPLELRLLHALMARPDVVFSRQKLLDTVWGLDECPSERAVDVYVHRVRAALARAGHADRIECVRGVGYRFVPPERTASPPPARRVRAERAYRPTASENAGLRISSRRSA